MEFVRRNLLEDSESDSEPEHRLTINEHYAKAFAFRKEREELSKLKEKYGSDAELRGDNEDSESDESEDEDGEELTPAIDAAILRTLSKIRQKDPDIYDNSKDVFEEEKARVSSSAPWGYKPSKNKAKDKAVTFKQLNVKSLLESGARSPSPEPSRPTYVEEQAALRSETIAAFHSALPSASGAGEDGEETAAGILTLREKNKDELEKEEEEYRAYLEREVGDVQKIVQLDPGAAGGTTSEPSSSASAPVAPAEGSVRKGARDKEQSNHEFLINYIVNRGWIDRDSRHLPTYDELTAPRRKIISGTDLEATVTNDKETQDFNAETREIVPDLDELEEFEDVADHFESTYNFRFEEPGAQSIHRHPRNIASAVRREKTTRKEARDRKKTRKQEEIAHRKEEIQRLKALKMRELKKKLDLVSKEGGLADEALQELDLEGDWDPSKHDAQMTALYSEDINEDAEGLEKPVWEDDIEISDIVQSERKSKKQKKKEERRKAKVTAEQDEGVDVEMMDADTVGTSNVFQDDEEWDGTEEMRKRKVAEYMDAVYGMEFNDIIGGDLPTRFKYTPVDKSSFNLTAAEILMANNAELNEYIGMKKLVPYKKGRQPWDAKRLERLRELKKKIRQRFGDSPWVNEVEKEWGAGRNGGEKRRGEEGGKKKRRGKRERMKERAQAIQVAEGEAVHPPEDAKVTQASEDFEPEKRTSEAAENEEEVSKESRRKKKRRRKADSE